MMRWSSLIFIALLGGSFTLLEGTSKLLAELISINPSKSVFVFIGAPAPETTKSSPSTEDEDKNIFTCNLCEDFVNDIYELLRNGTVTDEQIVDYIVGICIRLDIFANPDQVCGGMARIALVWSSVLIKLNGY